MVVKKLVWVRCKGILLALWSSKCFECIRVLVSTMVEVNKAMLTREVLEFARLRIRVPVGKVTRLAKTVKLNEFYVRFP